jgi:two-component system phosphate regulon sensor histidine kinase PhoR
VTSSEPHVRERSFPLLFFEPALMSSLPEPRPVVRMWTAQVRPAPGADAAVSTLRARMLLLSSLAGAASLVAVLLTVRAVRVSTELATMKSDFVAAVTHELKTPVALIALVGETLERGRYTSVDTIRDYAAILSQEARRLNHLIENLLTYSRLNDMAGVYAFEPVDLNELVEDALTPFRPRLNDLGFEVDVQVEPELAPVLADRAAMVRVFANVIDNAIKYSTDGRSLIIAATRASDTVRLSFTDRGVGIPADELPHVFEKFYRVQRTSEFGSGLGLAIVRRIVNDHRGVVGIESVVGSGSMVTITLPMAQRT